MTTEKRYDGQSTNPFSTTKVDWEYDDDGRLIGEFRDGGTASTNGQPNDGDDYLDAYGYDLNGNRINKSHAFYSGTGTRSQTTDYEYDTGGNDHLLTETLSETGQTDIVITYAYDDNGSTTEKTTPGGTVHYLWDLRNHLVGLDANNDGDAADEGETQYAYASDGIRIEKVEHTATGDVITLYVNDQANPTGYSQVLEEKASATATPDVTYVIGNDVIGQARASNSNALEYLMYDGHGSTRALLDTNGAVASGAAANDQLFDYDTFGNALGTTPSDPLSSLLYSGEQWDSEKGSYYLRGRPGYDPSIGRFTSFDFGGALNANDPRSLHRYVYANDDPESHIDPSGLSSTFMADLGKEIHRGVYTLYKDEFPLNEKAFDESPDGIGGALRPDIIDYDEREIGEVKPLSVEGLARGAIQLPIYLKLFNGVQVTVGGNSYAIPPVNGGGWTPSKWKVGVRAIPIEDPYYKDWVAFTVGNAFGLIIYKAVHVKSLTVMTAAALAKVAEQIEQLCNQLTRSVSDGVKAGSPSLNMAQFSALDQQLESAIDFSLSAATAKKLAMIAGPALILGLFSYLAVATNNSVMAKT